jgi:predicted metal-dependent hydrolase
MPRLPGLPAVEITLLRSPRARRVSLRVSRLDGAVTLTLPPRMREAEAMAFLQGQEGWLRRALARRTVVQAVAIGATIPVEGRHLTLSPGPGRAVRPEGDALLIPGNPAQAAPRAAAWLKALARDRLAAASDRHASALGRRYSTLTLRDTRSRWGSCTAAGGLMYSWRLVMAPPQVLDYVAAHEVAHLAEMNHSPAFWAVVARLYPAHAAARAWLKAEGAALHAFRFTAGD